MFGKDFPISDYYKDHIVDAITIKRGGSWWSAVLLIDDPQSKKRFINFYKWQLTDKGWKIRSRFKINSKDDCLKVEEILSKYVSQLV